MKKFRDRALQILFFLTLSWQSFWLLAANMKTIFGLMPVPEEHWLHDAVEAMVLPVAFIALAAVAVYCFRRWPWFLRIPESISLAWLTVRLLGYAPLLFAALAVVIFSAWRLFVVPGEDPEHSQYGLSAWFAAYFYAIFLTPSFTVIIVWLSALRKHRKITG